MGVNEEITVTVRVKLIIDVEAKPLETAAYRGDQREQRLVPGESYGSGPISDRQREAIGEASKGKKLRVPDDLDGWSSREAGEYLSILTSGKEVTVPMSVAQRRAQHTEGSLPVFLAEEIEP